MKRRDFLAASILTALASRRGFSARGPEILPHASVRETDQDQGTSDESSRPIPTAQEMRQANQWFVTAFADSADALPFSFTYGGKASNELLAAWNHETTNTTLGESRTQRAIVWIDADTDLEVRCIATIYHDFPVVEWTIYFKNTGRHATPILKNILGLDIHLHPRSSKEVVLHYNSGDYDNPKSFQPFSEILPPNVIKAFSASGGRPTSCTFPYYNLQTADGGVIAAVGWPGEWAASFRRNSESDLHLTAGQELTHLYLEPNEEVRSPLITLLFWQSTDWVRAQNIWRHWMLAHTLPRPGGTLLPPIFAYCDGAFYPGLEVNEAGEESAFEALTRHQVRLDYWWLDAGWYPCGDNWYNTGTWEPDLSRFPGGLRAVSDYVHRRETKLIVWFEPERVTAGSWLANNHPEWLLQGSSSDQEHGSSSSLLHLGMADVQAWLVDHIGGLIASQGIDLYRQDFNINPLPFWRRNDPADRQGITENLYVQGYLAYFDALRRRFPDMPIDTCASGGRRLDLETLRRAVPLTRSDYSPFNGDPASATGNQGQTYGLSFWIPYYGQGAYIQSENIEYYARSYMCPTFSMPVDLRKNSKRKIDWKLYHRLIREWQCISKCMMWGDFYPLTEYNMQNNLWIAWQFNYLEENTGLLQAFRRDQSEQISQRFRLNGVAAAAQYRVTSLDTAVSSIVQGSDLLKDGLLIEIRSKPGSAIITYEKVPARDVVSSSKEQAEDAANDSVGQM